LEKEFEKKIQQRSHQAGLCAPSQDKLIFLHLGHELNKFFPQIFTPLFIDQHWLIITFDLQKKQKIILDSMNTSTNKAKTQRVVGYFFSYHQW
jgi:hypothetical protein